MKNSLKINNILVEIQDINILKILSFLSPSIIYYVVKREISPSYNLRKEFKIKNVKTKALPIEVIRKNNDIDEARLLQQKYGSLIVDFFNTLSQEIPNEDLTLLFNNFNTLTITTKSFKLSSLISRKNVVGQYIAKENKIKVSDKDYELTIDHELFHASSTIVDSETGIVFTGFSQIINEDKKIGEGLNEGYTQHLTEKYFGKKKKILTTYAYEVKIAEAIEMIVGEKQMQSLYFNANLNGLIDILKQYNTEEKIYDFIISLDLVNKYVRQNINSLKATKIIINTLIDINWFLLETFINKIIYENPDRKDYKTLISENKKSLTKFIGMVPQKINFKKKPFILIDEDILANKLIDIVSNYESNLESLEKSSKKLK